MASPSLIVFRKHAILQQHKSSTFKGNRRRVDCRRLRARRWATAWVHVFHDGQRRGARQWRLGEHKVSEVSLYIGGELIDRHDGVFAKRCDRFVRAERFKIALGPHPGASSIHSSFPFASSANRRWRRFHSAPSNKRLIEIRWGTGWRAPISVFFHDVLSSAP